MNIDWLTIKTDPYNYIKKLKTDEIVNIVNEANKHYHNNESKLGDNIYDLIIDYLENERNYIYSSVGSNITVDKKKTKLPVYMGSMDKYKPKDDLNKWKKKFNNSYLISDKLDGSSGLYVREPNGNVKLYTRGNGTIGQDVSYLQNYINLIKKNINYDRKLIVRGEFIITKKNWLKYKSNFSNSRNLVSGLINSKYIKNKSQLKDIDFVAYELIEPMITPKKQFLLLKDLGFNVVNNSYHKDFDKTILSNILMNRREMGDYEIDGIIVTDNKIYKREIDKNPKHSFAFKIVLTEQLAETTVLDVDWHISSWGVLKPVVKLKPIKLEGVCIKNVTGINAKFIKENKIGPGAVLQIIRSGSVIPKIEKIITPVLQGKLPNNIDFIWNNSKVDIIINNYNNLNKEQKEELLTKKILKFINSIGCEQFKSSRIKKVIQSEKLNSIPKILNATIEDFLEIEGFKLKSATNIVKSIQECFKKASLINIMAGSGCFGYGLGEKKMLLIMQNIPDLFKNENYSLEMLTNMINKIKGFSKKTTIKFVDNIEKFRLFCKSINYNINKTYQTNTKKKNLKISDKFNNLKFLFTGFRNKDFEETITNNGGILLNSFKKDLNYLIVKNNTISNNKTKLAKKLNIPIITNLSQINL